MRVLLFPNLFGKDLYLRYNYRPYIMFYWFHIDYFPLEMCIFNNNNTIFFFVFLFDYFFVIYISFIFARSLIQYNIII